ncbi:MAG TPA: Hsp20/alpha crystallin family protein [Methylomirabilota bacterium]|jgi:HSP20 family molecular chaperone IbpA
MRYRRLRVRYAMVAPAGHAWPYGELWPSDRLRILVQSSWRPDADLYETAASVEVAVELAGVDEENIEIELFDDVLVVGGRRRLPPATAEALYHAAAIRQGAFRVALPLPVPVDPEQVEVRYDRGLLHISLPKRPGAA